ncbi:unnamed protein product, partial [Mycena citricolor]
TDRGIFGRSTPSMAPPEVLDYNVTWMDHTFRTRKNTASLLDPELENGNLTRRDYDAVMGTLPGFHYSEMTGFAMSGAGTLAYARFYKTPTPLVGLAGYAFGAVIGKAFRIYTHLSLLRSIDDVRGFARAMDNVKAKVGYSPGLLSVRRNIRPKLDEEDAFQADTEAYTFAETNENQPEHTQRGFSSPPTLPPPHAAPTANSKSRWDEIRAQRSTPGESRAWDNIRHGRRADGTPLPKPTPSSLGNENQETSSTPFAYRDDDRAAAQASFDAMLERERRMNS